MSIPYEILIRGKGGAFRGAHVIEESGGDARPVTADDLAALGVAIDAGLLARVAELLARVAQLEAELADPRPSAPAAPVLGRLAEAYGALPAEVQAAFAASFAVVRVLVDAGRADLARAHVASLTVPGELEATRQGILDLLAA